MGDLPVLNRSEGSETKERMMLPTEILRASVWKNVEKLVSIKCQNLRKRSTKSKLERDKESAVLKRKQDKKIITLPILHLPLIPPPLYLIPIHTTPSNPME